MQRYSKTIILTLCFITLLSGCLYWYLKPTREVPTPPIATTTVPAINGIFNDVNTARTQVGLHPLILSTDLNTAATNKCSDMVKLNYFAHTRPNGQLTWTFITVAGVQYNTAGENIADGDYDGSQAVVNAWLASPEHRANIMNTTYKYEGLAICMSKDGSTLIDEYFTDTL